MKAFFKKLFGRYDVPADHTWSKTAVDEHRIDPVSPDKCERCQQPWTEHEFGAPRPYCPETK